MNENCLGNMLTVSNYPSDTAYAWWLMEHFWKTLAELYDKAGYKTYLAYPKITTISYTVSKSLINPVELTIPWKNSQEYTNVSRFIKKNNIRQLYFTDQPYLNLKYILLRLKGVKRIVIHDHTPGDRPPVKGLKGFIKAVIHTIPWITADKILCVSPLMRQRNILNSRIPPHKCAVVQNGINPVVCNTANTEGLRYSLGINSDSFLVVTTGRAHPYKRFDFIIQCANFLKQKAPNLDVVFILVGDGPAMSALHDMVTKYNLEKTVRLLGFRNDTHNLLCISDVALHAALGEGFSLSITEYMSAGLPTLVPDIPSVRQAIDHNKTGFVYPKDDVEKVTNYLIDLATNNNMKISIGRSAKIQATEMYTLDKCTQEFITAMTK